jgi:hypothetical protein
VGSSVYNEIKYWYNKDENIVEAVNVILDKFVKNLRK